VKAVIAWLVVLVVVLAAYSYRTDPKLAASCVGPAPSATVVGSRVLRRMGELVNADPHPPAAIKADVDKVLRVLRLLFWSLKFSANDEKIPPEIIELERADDERRRNSPLCSVALEDELPCPPPATEAPDDGAEPWDPKLASLQADQGFTAEQRSITAAAVQVAAEHRLPASAAVVAVTAGLVESEVRNLDHGDRDSLGWLQQRASWGPASERLNPAVAAGKFYDHLVRVPSWQTRPVGEVAQAVQVSAFPDRYALRVSEARRLVASVGAAPAAEAPDCTPAANSPGEGLAALGNRRTPAQAVAYMRTMARTQASDGAGRCLHFVGMAYGYPTTADYYAIDQWRNAPARYRHTSPNPPAGALMFWDTGKRAGHVAISLGNGQVASTDTGPRGGIGIHPVAYFQGYGRLVGWTDPYFRNQTNEGANA
jgi:hypothetical protein